MTENSWLDMEIPLEKRLTLESHRRAAVKLHLHELQAVHDSLMVSYTHLAHMLNQAMRRVAELELREASQVEAHHHEWAREVLTDLGQ